MTTRLFERIAAPICGAVFTAALLLIGPSGDAGADSANGKRGRANRERTSVQPIRVFGAGTLVPGGGSLLTRFRDGVYMSLHSFGLVPGEAVTAWWVFFNDPKDCATSPCTAADLANAEAEPSLVYATGRVVGADGTADFGAFRAVGDATGAVSGAGLLNAFKAEIHLVVRSHGAALMDDPQALAAQLSGFNGGCPPNACANIQVSVHQP